jgi:hypothetical protein
MKTPTQDELWDYEQCLCPKPEKIDGDKCNICHGKIYPKGIKSDKEIKIDDKK